MIFHFIFRVEENIAYTEYLFATWWNMNFDPGLTARLMSLLHHGSRILIKVPIALPNFLMSLPYLSTFSSLFLFWCIRTHTPVFLHIPLTTSYLLCSWLVSSWHWAISPHWNSMEYLKVQVFLAAPQEESPKTPACWMTCYLCQVLANTIMLSIAELGIFSCLVSHFFLILTT